MNAYMATFFGLGFVYVLIFTFGLITHSGGVMVIGVLGMLLCTLGWLMSKRLLQ